LIERPDLCGVFCAEGVPHSRPIPQIPHAPITRIQERHHALDLRLAGRQGVVIRDDDIAEGFVYDTVIMAHHTTATAPRNSA